MASLRSLILPAAMASLALARTDLTGCTSTDVSSPAGASLAWYVPGTGELCDFLDCGGGTAPPKTDVPGCPMYSGTSTYSPSYMPGYGSATAAASSSWSQATETGSAMSGSSASWSAWETDSAASSWDLYTTAPTPASSAWASASSSWASAGNTASPLICALGSCAPGSTSTYTWSTSTSMVLSTAAAGTAANGTMAGSTGGAGGASNGTAPSHTAAPSSSVITGGAAETAKAWVGAGLMVGLGAVVAAL